MKQRCIPYKYPDSIKKRNITSVILAMDEREDYEKVKEQLGATKEQLYATTEKLDAKTDLE